MGAGLSGTGPGVLQRTMATTAALIAAMPKTPFLTAAMAVPPPLR